MANVPKAESESSPNTSNVNLQLPKLASDAASLVGPPAPPLEAVRRMSRVIAAPLEEQQARRFAAMNALEPDAFIRGWTARRAAYLSRSSESVQPRVEPLAPWAAERAAELLADSRFAAIYPGAEFRMVEIGKLATYQPSVDLGVCACVGGDGIHGALSETQVADICFPREIFPTCPTRIVQNGTNLWVYCKNSTFTVQHFGLDQGAVTIAMNVSANLLLVRTFKDRFVLCNGNHRSYALRARGVDMAPVVIVPANAEAEVCNPNEFFGHPIVFGSRPTIVDDFFDDAVAFDVETRATMRQVRISAEVLEVPLAF